MCPLSTTLRILMSRQNTIGWRLVLNYMWTPPTHHYLESSGRASYMKTHPSSFSFLFFLRHRADMPPSKNMMQLTTWQVSCQVESRCHSRNLFLEIWVSLSPSLSPLNIYSVLSFSDRALFLLQHFSIPGSLSFFLSLVSIVKENQPPRSALYKLLRPCRAAILEQVVASMGRIVVWSTSSLSIFRGVCCPSSRF